MRVIAVSLPLLACACVAFAATLIVYSPIAAAQQPAANMASYDGVWKGTVSQASVTLKVKGGKGDLKITCQTVEGFADVKVGQDGTLSGYVKTGVYRRAISGKLPDIVISEGGSCGGNATLAR